MRLPLLHVYRAFPALDAYSDQDCRQFVRLTLALHWQESVRVTLGCLVIAAMLMALGTMAGARLFVELMSSSVRTPERRVMAFAVFGAMVGFGPVVALVLRDRWLRRKLGDRLRLCECLACGYSLVGLAVRGEQLLCPECGRSRLVPEGDVGSGGGGTPGAGAAGEAGVSGP